MRILFDTNVLVSAFLAGGSCYDVIEDSIHGYELYYTAFIINEFDRILRNNFRFSGAVINEFVSFIKNFFVKGNTADKINNICKDKDDNQLLADAVINKVDVIITGDKDLLVLKTYKGIKIVSHKEYWKL